MRAFLVFAVLAFYSCRNSTKITTRTKLNDTAVAIHTLLDHYLRNWEKNKAGSHLLKDKPFGDSVIFVSNADFNSFFVDYGKVKFKILDSSQICDYAVSYFRTEAPMYFFPNVLLLTNFYETDSTIFVSIQAECALPNFDKNGNRLETTEGLYAGNDKCTFSRMCGPGYEVELVKRGDSLVVGHAGGWSD